ncbi:MAG: DUF6519 domain-containing protein [Kiloniellaceae bacterium]
MPSLDISRNILQPQKRYVRVGFQQGRVPLDSDANDAEALGAEELGRALAETICSAGSPNDGFRIDDVEADAESGFYDFSIGQGSFYLGGQRYEQAAEDMTYTGQTDWLQRVLDAADVPAVPEAERNDLVWLEAWEQPISPTEDAELIEPALGVDTTGRVRRTWRVRVETGVTDDCRLAFEDIIDEAYPGATLDTATGALNSDTELTVDFVDGDPENLCTPTVRGGYLGARNETYRVRITDPGRFIWGRDNASPVYRVRAVDHEVDGVSTGLRRIEFITPPRDQFAQPLAGQAVELHRWGALLPNGEKQAEAEGLLLTVERGYDPADDSIVVSAAVPDEWWDWFDAEGAAALSGRDDPSVQRYLYLRLWSGATGDAADPDHSFNIAEAVELGDTGLTVEFSDEGRPGDYWIISARPNTPLEVQPWRLLEGAPPNGPGLRVAPLALIRWRADAGGGLAPDVEDCRHRFRPLCRVGTCCTVTVGDGEMSFGDVDSIAAAIARLPEEGGEVCILPGEYREHVVLDRSDVIFSGCGTRSLWLAEPGNDTPLLTISDAANVTVRRLAMVGTEVSAIVMERASAEGLLDTILLSELSIVAADRAGIAGFDGSDIAVERCEIFLAATSATLEEDPAVGREPAIYLSGEELRVERCRILADLTQNAASQPLGGMQIGGGSDRVILRRNIIDGGNGHGIILGSIRYVPADPRGPGGLGQDSYTADLPYHGAGSFNGSYAAIGIQISIDEKGCITFDPLPNPPDDEAGNPLVPASEGVLYDLRIHDNDILNMGLSGISVPFFFDLVENPDLIGVERLDVSRNRINGCLRGDLVAFTDTMTLAAGYGGIALAQVGDGTFRDNEIVDNGRASLVQISGIFILFAAAITIERNLITDNGGRAARGDLAPLGRRGGVVLGLVLDGAAATFSTGSGLGRRRQALRLHDNVVDSPNARALKAIALGPVSVTGNRLNGRGRSVLGQYGPLIGVILAATVGPPIFQAGFLGLVVLALGARLNLFGAGLAILEIYLEIIGGDVVSLIDVAPAEELTELLDNGDNIVFPEGLLGGGEILFNDNQVSHAAHAPGSATSLSAVLLSRADDVSACGNQFECENDLQFVFINGLITGLTVRVANNRFQERVSTSPQNFHGYVSAFTAGAGMNTTLANQGTHCFFVAGPPALRIDVNQSLLAAAFPAVCGAAGKAAGRLALSGSFIGAGQQSFRG